MTHTCSSRINSASTRSWQSCHPFESAPPASDHLRVRFGQRTFDSEGVETPGRFFSRRATFPGGNNSGVTIGRGYDMGHRAPSQIVRELLRAGIPQADAKIFSGAAGLRGSAAERFVRLNKDALPLVSIESQKTLFEEVVTPEIISDIQRIFDKPDTVKAYGRPVWDDLSPVAQELIFDLRFRGDYTPTTRKRIQRLLVEQDYSGLKEVINDTSYWARLGVPRERIRERQSLASNLPQTE
jgi:hypothetical protein